MNNNQVLQTIHERRTIRKYKNQPLSKEQIQNLVEAALISPSAMNMEPWHISVLTDNQTILEWEKVIVDYFVNVNDEKMIEHNKSRNNKIFYDAPVVFVISMEKNKAMDVGIVAQSITLAAKSMGLDSVILGLPRVSFDPRYNGKWEETLKFPKDYVYGISVAVGYGDDVGRKRTPDLSKVTYL